MSVRIFQTNLKGIGDEFHAFGKKQIAFIAVLLEGKRLDFLDDRIGRGTYFLDPASLATTG